MKKILKSFVPALVLMLGLAAILVVPQTGAVDVFDECGSNPDSAICQSQDDDLKDILTIAINVLLYVVGAAAVVTLIVGGIFYITSNGDPANVTKAKNTVLYSITGLVVAFSAYAIVNWVIGYFIK